MKKPATESEDKKQRITCPMCGKRPVAINRYSGEKVYYRKMCDCCSRAKAAGKILKPQPPAWVKTGYKKKPQCEVCGFKLKIDSQSQVYHVDGNTQNNHWTNLRTVCLNCQQEIGKLNLPWKSADLIPDF